MNPPKNSKSRGGIYLRVLLGVAIILAPLMLMAQVPGWWGDKQVLISGSNVTRNDYAALNQGQLKNIATKAIAELNQTLPGAPLGAGETLNSLAATLSSTSAKTNDYAAVNLGQLKAISKPFLDRLLSVGYQGHPLESGTYPWIGHSANDYAMANIGQVKNLFSFDLANFSVDTDHNRLADDWEILYFGYIGLNPDALAPNGSGLTLLESYEQGLDPIHAPVAAYPISLSVTGTAISPGSATLMANVSGATSAIQRIDFYQGDSYLASTYQSPWRYLLTNLNVGIYQFKAVSTDVNGLTATGTATFTVNPPAVPVCSNYYNRTLVGGDRNYISSVIALDLQKGVLLDGTNNDYTSSNWYPNGLPWFLRTKAEANVPWQHILSGSSGINYVQFNAPVVVGGTSMGGAPPLVAFGSQGSGTPLYINQYYNFGVVAGGMATTGTNDFMIEVYEKTAFANNAANVTPITSGTIKYTMPRAGTSAWTAFEQNGFVTNFPAVSGTFNGKPYCLETRVQYVPEYGAAWGQAAPWPLLVSHKSTSSDFVYKVSFMGSEDSTHPMAKDSTGSQTYNVTYSLDFDQPSATQSSYISQPHFQTTPLPSAYQGKSLEELVHNAPAVAGTLTVTGTSPELKALDKSPELKSHPILDKLVSDMGSDPMALANYVLNEIGLTDAIGYNAAGQVADASISPTGVSRDALATYLEGQGSPTEQCALLVYLLRKANVPCGYIFPQQGGTLMFDEQLSKLLQMQLRGAQDSMGHKYTTLQLIPVNYPWVAAYVGGKWIHLFPWLKDTAVEEGYDIWDYMPTGYQTGAQWLRHYLLDDPAIRSLSTEADNPGTLFPLWVKSQLQKTYPGMSIDDLGVKVYNRRNYYTRWEDFPRPWQTPTISNANFAQSLTYAQDSTLNTALQNIFDTVSVKLYKDTGTGKVETGQSPIITTGTMRLVDLHNRRFLIYHQPVNNGATYNAFISLDAYRTTASGTNNFMNGPGDLLNKQVSSASLSASDDKLLLNINYKRHRQLPSNFVNPDFWTPFLGFSEELTNDDTRPLRKGDMAAFCMEYGRVSQKMEEVHAEKYWNYQQQLSGTTGTADPEQCTGELLYLMGMSYYFKVTQFQQKVEGWTKTHAVTWTAHGLAKLAPSRTSGTINIINGDIDLRYPNVDMGFIKTAWAGNGTTHLDSGDDMEAGFDAFVLMMGEVSADEHRAINDFFQQDAAVSTVKLLDLAQGSTPGSNVIELNCDNYVAFGETSYTAPKTDGSGTATQKLKDWAGTALWSEITGMLTDTKYGKFTSAIITPGPVQATAQLGQPYTGMGTFIIGVGDYRALISNNTIQNGGFGGYNNYNFYSSTPPVSYVTNTFVLPTIDFGYTLANTSFATLSAPISLPSIWSDNSYSSFNTGISTSSMSILPDFSVSLSSFAWNTGYSSSPTYNVPSTGYEASSIITAYQNIGYAGSSSYNGNLSVSIGASSNGSYGSSSFMSDPVNVVTGEFYVDALDLKLNGPMPLEIRRNYGSLNKADNNFGQGWRMSYFPYLVFSSTDSAVSPQLITAAEMDGSVVVYRKQTSPDTLWIPTPGDNPNLMNLSQGIPGGLGNVYNNKLVLSGTDTFVLTGADGSVRTFKVRAFDQDGSGLSRKRPYLESWKDNKGNSYSFTFGNVPTAPDYGQVRYIKSSNGNFVGFYYDTYGHITEAYTGDGRRLYYDYDNNGDLIQVTLPDASMLGYDYEHLPIVGTGLTGNYYSDTNLGTKVLTRTDATINFDWGTGSPGSPVPVDNFSVRWTGLVKPQYSETYTFYVTGDDGIRLWVNGRLLCDGWKDQGPTEYSGTIALVAGQKYDIRIEYYERGGGTTARLSWSSAHQAKQVVPTSQLFPNTNPASTYSSHLLTQETKPGGRVLKNNYDSAGRVTSQYSTVGTDLTPVLSGSFTYVSGTNADNTHSGTTTFVDARGYTTTYVIENSQIKQITDPTGTINQEWYWTDDGSGGYRRSLKKRTDKRGLITEYKYDSRGNPVEIKVTGALKGDPAITGTSSALTTTVFNSLNLVTSSTDAINNVTVYGYGDATHPYLPTSVEKRAPGGSISTNLMSYQDVTDGAIGAYGLLQQLTVASGSEQAVTVYGNNANGFITSKTQYTNTDDPNIVTYYSYNLRGEVTSETDAANRSTVYTYDGRGNRTGAMRYDEYGMLVSWRFNYYNQNGEIEWTQGPRYAPDDFLLTRYDGAGRMKEQVKWLTKSGGFGVVSDGQATTFYSYDKTGNLIEVNDPRQTATTMTYDGVGQMLTRIVHNGDKNAATIASESFTYEPGGQVTTHTDVLGGVETRKYTSNGLLYEADKADGTTAKYRYDLTGRVVRETLTNNSYWTTDYDDLNRTVTRKFFNSGNTQLAMETQRFDRRGNLVSKTDTANYTLTTTYDGLNRPKKAVGPPASGATAQQTVFHVYDVAGKKHTITNATGERTETAYDAEQRPVSVKSWNRDGSVASISGYSYAPDHNSVTTTVGSGTNAIWSTTYTNTFGQPVLLFKADGTYQMTAYDVNGNKTAFQDEIKAITQWSYDALNHLKTETLPASSSSNSAVINYTFDAAGNLLTRRMPTGQAGAYVTGTSTFDTAGRKTSEKLLGTDGSVTRNFTYHYYAPSDNTAWTGLFKSTDDPRGFTDTTTYDEWLRTYTVNSVNTTGTIPQQAQNTTYLYDPRNLLTSVSQAYASGTTGPSTTVTRGYDGYGQMNAETIAVSGTTVSQWAQSWDGAGRRSSLNCQLPAQGIGAGSQYSYQYNAAGQITKVINTGTCSFVYADNGLLNQRITPLWTQTVTSRDSRGRVLTQNTSANGITPIAETLTWRDDSRINSYAVVNTGTNVTSETRVYGYDKRGRLTNEPFVMNGQQSATYYFDQPTTSGTVSGASTENGLGVRTLQFINSTVGYQVQTENNFKQPSKDFLLTSATTGAQYNFNYDAVGNVTSRAITGGGVQTFTWDALGRMATLTARNPDGSGYVIMNVYDGLGRRVQTSLQNMAAGGVPSGAVVPLTYQYDPQVEFLQLGITNGGTRQWNVYGPDLNGVYGGLQGTGGLSALVSETNGSIVGQLNNFFGDIPVINTTAWQARATTVLGGYGPMPGSGLSALTPRWRGCYADWTGFIYKGARYYDPSSGRFLSPDPLGHAASMSLYDYCNGDPVNGLDPDGRCVKGFSSGWSGSISAGSPNSTAFQVGAMVGAWTNGGLTGLGQGAKNDVAVVGVTGAAILGGKASYVYVNGITDWAGWTDTKAQTLVQQQQYNTTIYNATNSVQEVSFAVSGAYQAPKVTAPAPVVRDNPALLNPPITIGGRSPINSSYAGQTHPSGVQFTNQGFPDFSPYAQAQVKIAGLTGNIKIDSKLANDAMCYPNTPQGYTWHHVEDGKTMQLVPQDIHQEARHTGGAAVIRNGGFDQ